MAATTFHQVQGLIDQLTPLEQAQLLEYLTPRIVRNIVNIQPTARPKSGGLAEAWQAFFQIGDELIKSDRAEALTLTQAVQAMRR